MALTSSDCLSAGSPSEPTFADFIDSASNTRDFKLFDSLFALVLSFRNFTDSHSSETEVPSDEL